MGTMEAKFVDKRITFLIVIQTPWDKFPFVFCPKKFFWTKRFLLPKQSLDLAQNFIFLTHNQQIIKMTATLNKSELLLINNNEQKFNLWLLKYIFV